MSSTNYDGMLSPSLPLPEQYHDGAPHEFIKCLKSPQRSVALSWDEALEDREVGGWVCLLGRESREKPSQHINLRTASS